MEEPASPPPSAEIRLQTQSSVFDSNDPRWGEQVQVLLDSLRANVGPVSRHEEAVPGMKGGIAEIVVALGSAGAFTAAIQVFRMWLSQRTDREIVIERTVGKKTERTVISGKNCSEATIRAALAHPAAGG